MNTTTNILANAIAEDMNDLINGIVSTAVESDEKQPWTNNEGEIGIPLSSIDKLNIFVDYDLDEDDERNMNGDYFDTLENMIDTKNIIKMKSTMNELKGILLDIFKNKDTSIYGVIVVDGDCRYNIMHPITSYLISIGEIVLPDVMTIMIYTYKKDSHNTLENNSYIEDIANIVNIIKTNGYKAKGLIALNQSGSSSISSSRDKYFMDALFKFKAEGNARPEFALIPVQMASYSVAYPYYGAVVSYTSGSEYYSKNLCGMTSGNINVDANYKDEWCATCTGSLSNSKFNSLFSLNNMNLNSMFYEKVIHTDIRDWTFACQMFSIYQLFSKEIDENIITKEVVPTSPQSELLSDIKEECIDREFIIRTSNPLVDRLQGEI